MGLKRSCTGLNRKVPSLYGPDGVHERNDVNGEKSKGHFDLTLMNS